jgi:hypothetical protein
LRVGFLAGAADLPSLDPTAAEELVTLREKAMSYRREPAE